MQNSEIIIVEIFAEEAADLCRVLTADLPEYFGLPECNEQYMLGVQSRHNFAAKLGDDLVGLLSLDFPYQTNSSIYWMAISRQYQGHGIGHKLIHAAAQFAREQGATTMTVETLAPSESDENYLKTYHFYESCGFKPLFNLKPDGYEWNMVYMCKSLDVNMTTRKYQPGDARALADIYYHTIHDINSRDYSETQINAWAPASSLELTGWQEKWSKLPPIVALSNHKIVGFAEFESDGHIDCFYVHHEYQGKSVGTCLMNEIEREANAKNITRIYAEVSITAKSFFEKKGFDVIKQQTVLIRGCELTNFVMEKHLTPLATFRLLEQADISEIAKAFQLINWGKPASLFEAYLEEQRQDERNIWVAFVDDKFAGYVTLKWRSEYEPFADRGIPEVKDLNVLPVYQGKGIGSKLLEIAESAAYTKSNTVGLGVGLFADYGNAQRLYIKRGYIPDGLGVTYQYKELSSGCRVQLDDDLVLWLTKSAC